METHNENKQPPRHTALMLALLVAGVAGAGPVGAATEWGLSTLDDPILDQQRGGFRIGNLEISIGLEQVVAIDGQIEVINRLLIPNLNQSVGSGAVAHQIEQVQVSRPAASPTSGSSGSGVGGSSSQSTPVASSSPAQGTTISSPMISTGANATTIVASELRSGAWATRIQNDVNERVIQNIRSLNIQLNNVGLPSYLPDNFLQTPAR
ncbi:hypothetical protein [Marinobacter mangrovi]|uniref:hypothetical protein n=1 Tax=Marinobacter mangrovi TaxID=2803918 RepID=UPI001934A0B0|nr:hypothetical protein [Marinobacter mangrovi]